jgi:HAD superfamily hydrolase (TIGR01509 family)
LILLSNTDVIHFTEIKKRYSFLKYFDSIVLSYEARHRKPSPLIFYKAMKKTKSKPYECAYFDDVWQFVLVARLFGIKSMQFKGAFKLKKDLKKLGI